MDIGHDCVDAAVIKADNFSFSYEPNQATSLFVGDLQIPAGQFVVVCGPSGGGKSTFLKLLNGLIPDYVSGQLRGKLAVANKRAGERRVEELTELVASVFQDPSSQFFHKLVREELVFPAENQGRNPEEILGQLSQLVDAFSIKPYLEREMLTLSGGEKQRVALLSAVMQASPILLLDEPTAHLDVAGVKQVREYLQKLKTKGKTILLAEHRMDYMSDLADRYLYFNQGRIQYDWTREEFLSLSIEVRRELCLRSIDLPDLSACYDEKKTTVSGLTVKGLQLKAGREKLAKISQLFCPRGVVTAIVGNNGIGKTTLAHYLAGLLEDKGAQFQLDGVTLSAKKRLQKTALILQEVRLQLFSESVKKELCLGLPARVDVTQMLQKLGLEGLENRHPMTLSGGEQQRLVIASQLLSDKEVFIFDEPTSGLDYEQMLAVSQILKDLAAQNKVVILITHDVELLSYVADQVVRLPATF